MNEEVVLDTSALAVLLFGEHGADLVEPHMQHSTINAVNVAELLVVFGRRG